MSRAPVEHKAFLSVERYRMYRLVAVLAVADLLWERVRDGSEWGIAGMGFVLLALLGKVYLDWSDRRIAESMAQYRQSLDLKDRPPR